MSVKLLTEQCLELLSLKGGCTGWSESTVVIMPHCWKSHVMALLFLLFFTEAVSCNQYEDEEMDDDMDISCDNEGSTSSKEKSKLNIVHSKKTCVSLG